MDILLKYFELLVQWDDSELPEFNDNDAEFALNALLAMSED